MASDGVCRAQIGTAAGLRWMREVEGPDTHPGRSTRWRGEVGLSAYCAAFGAVTPVDPSEFEAIVYHRELSTVRAHAELTTPRRWKRSNAKLYRNDGYVSAIVHRFADTFTLGQNGRRLQVRQGDLLLVDTRKQFDAECVGTLEMAALFVPVGLLGPDIAHGDPGAALPMVADSIIGRATAEFVRTLAFETVCGATIELETELAAVDLIRAALAYGEPRPHDSGASLRAAAEALLKARFHEADFSPETMATELGISRRHLYRLFTDSSPAAVINERRLERARVLLRNADDMRLEEVARLSGFGSAATFRNRFRQKYDITPSEFREQCRSPQTT